MRRKSSLPTGAMLGNRGKRDLSSRVKDTILALALCHNVSILHAPPVLYLTFL
jgi:phospholipid-translocating ATPase